MHKAATRRAALAVAAAAFTAPAAAAQDLQGVLRDALGAPRAPSSLDPATAERGLRAALSAGARAAVARVARKDGYWGDAAIRIPLPRRLAQTQSALRAVGASAALDDLHLKLNRAAETAAPAARDLFLRAIQTMTVEDAIGLVRGGETSATEFLRRQTTTPLTGLMRPRISSALSEVGALRAADRLAARYGLSAAFGATPRDALTDHAVAWALEGVFHYVAAEERAIRRNPAKRTTALLREVFGAG